MKARWPAIRAGLIAFVLLVHGVLVFPVPSNVPENSFDNRIAKVELARWSEIAASVGLELAPEQIGDGLITIGQAIAQKKKAVLKPFRPILRTTGTGQAWGLFTYPNTRPNQLVISMREETSAGWQPLYEALDEDLDWHEAHFRYRKVRGVYDDNASKVRASYDNFCHWVAREVFAEHPDAIQVRVHMVQTTTTTPGEEPDETRRVRLVRVVKRKDLEE